MKAAAIELLNRSVRRDSIPKRTGGSYDVVDVAFLRAAFDSAGFYEDNLLLAKSFDNTLDMIEDGVRQASSSGLFLEFGVATGRTIRKIAETHAGPVFGFDSFEGLPEMWYPGYEAGAFARSDLPEVPDNVTLVKGWFNETLPKFVADHPGPVSYINVDCDLYSSTVCVLSTLADRIGPGCVIQFDEFFNYPGWRMHEYKAFMEFVAARGLRFRYHSFLRTHQAVCVIIE